MTRDISEEYFENRKEQAAIKLAITEALPVDVYYHNLIIALSEVLQRCVYDMTREDVYRKWKDDK